MKTMSRAGAGVAAFFLSGSLFFLQAALLPQELIAIDLSSSTNNVRVDLPGHLSPGTFRFATVHRSLLETLRPGDPIRISISPGMVRTGTLTRIAFQSETRCVWIGSLGRASDGYFILALESGCLAGKIVEYGHPPVKLISLPDGRTILVEGQAPDRPDALPLAGPGGTAPSTWAVMAKDAQAGPAILDLLVVYTPRARLRAGGAAALRAALAVEIEELNDAFAQSGLTTTCRLVLAAECDYPTTGNTQLDLNNITEWPSILSLQELTHADLVCFLADDQGHEASGRGHLLLPNMSGYSPFCTVVDDALGFLTLAHELGHNLGCHHNRADAYWNGIFLNGYFPYSYGCRFTGNSGTLWRTIMAYPPGFRINRFSNPLVQFDGRPTGVDAALADSADNAKTIAFTDDIVASFYPVPFLPPDPETLLSSGQTGLAMGDATVKEGPAGQDQQLVFQATLTSPRSQTVVVPFQTFDGSATAGSDYVAKAGTLTFPPGSVQQSVAVAVKCDGLPEPDEAFYVSLLSAPAGTFLLNPVGEGFIEGNSVISVTNQPVILESMAGKSSLAFCLRRQLALGTTVQVDVATSDGSAVANKDYVPVSGTVIFAPNETEKQVLVPILDDSVYEMVEKVNFHLSNPQGALVDSWEGQSVGILYDNDAPPVLTCADVSQPEGNAGVQDMVFTLHLTGGTEAPVQIDYLAKSASMNPADASDFTLVSGTVVMEPGTTTAQIKVQIKGDAVIEGDERIQLNLLDPVGATCPVPVFTGTILNDDFPALILAAPGVGESEGSAPLVLTLSAANPFAPVTATYSTEALTAEAGKDFTPQSGQVVFPPGSLSKTVFAPILQDTAVEPSETFRWVVDSVKNAVVPNAAAITSIQDDDCPDLLLTSATAQEGQAGLTCKVTLSKACAVPVSVAWETLEYQAQPVQDYVPASGTIVFNPGEQERRFFVHLVNDNYYETTECIRLRAVIQGIPASAVTREVAILDNDPMPTLAISDASVPEGSSHGLLTTSMAFKIQLTGLTRVRAIVKYKTVPGTASADNDYGHTSGTLNIVPGNNVQAIPVLVRGDYAVEPSEQFTVQLFSPQAATLSDGAGTGTILNDD